MKKITFILFLSVFILLTINAGFSQEIDNQTADDLKTTDLSEDILSTTNQTDLLTQSGEDTVITVKSTTNFDVVGDSFKVKLSDTNNNPIKNAKIIFTINGETFNKNTDSSGIASLQLNLNDGKYSIISKFSGDSTYKSSSLTTQITMNNIKVVGEGLTNFQIQKIINEAKDKNIILFTGKTYENINLVINKRLTLISNSNTVLKSSSQNPTILITGKSSSYSSVSGFNIQGNGTAIKVLNSDYVVITDNIISTQSDAIVVQNANYINITKNNISKNSKSAITLISVANSHVYNNIINNNGINAIQLADANNIYIYSNTILGNGKDGIYITDKINGNGGSASKNIYITYNNITKNGVTGINVDNAGDNVKIASNEVSSNYNDGILITKIGSNSVTSNVIMENQVNGLKFANEYVKPQNQDISSNVIYNNNRKDVDAKETYYQENGQRLELGENWYGDWGFVCPKIKTSNLIFKVSQVGKNQFRAEFLDSNGNIASLLPDRTLTYNSNGQTVSITVKGGIATFTVDANDGDLISAVVDRSPRNNIFDASIQSTADVVNGKSPEYSYPSIQYTSNYDMSQGNNVGKGMSTGTGGDGKSSGNGDAWGNASTSQNMNPSNLHVNQANSLSQSYQAQDVSQSGASTSGGEGASDVSESVVKQILIDEDDIYKVTGISFIIALMILTIGFYYRDDIKEMNAKR